MAISESPRWIEYHVRPENMPWSCNGLGNKNKHGYHIKLEYENIWARFVSAQYCDLRANVLDLMKCAKTKEHIYIIRCFHIRSKEIQTYSGKFWAWYYREKQFIWWVHATTYGMVISYVMFDVSQFSQSYNILFYYNIHTFIRFQVLSCIFTCHGFLHGIINSVNIADISDVEDKCITCSISTFSHEVINQSCLECFLDLKASVPDIISVSVAKICQSCCCPLVDCHDISLITFLSPKSLAISWYHFHVFFQSTYLPFTSLSTTRPILKHLLEGSALY